MISSASNPLLTTPGHLRSGDVLRYVPKDGWHCRQGTAIVMPNGAALDTYWGEEGGSSAHRLTDSELATAELMFNVGDYDEIGTVGHCRPSDEAKWLEYHPNDRQRIGSQSQYCAVLYVRKGSRPDLGTKIENAQAAVESAEGNLRSAEHRLEWARRDLLALEALAAAPVSSAGDSQSPRPATTTGQSTTPPSHTPSFPSQSEPPKGQVIDGE